MSTPVFTCRPDSTPAPDFDRMETDPVDMGIRTRRSGLLTEAGRNDARKVRRIREMARQEGRYTR
jgi:hypothetical protein